MTAVGSAWQELGRAILRRELAIGTDPGTHPAACSLVLGDAV